ncbi:hypothetical protein HWN76_27620, partial [Escherichia coli]|nr:hypothetical protein [Escherichia coli]
LSIFSLKPVVAAAIGEDGRFADADRTIRLVSVSKLTAEAIRESILLGVAREVGEALETGQRGALRRSVGLTPEAVHLLQGEVEEHARGEILVAAMMNAFVALW